MAGQRLPTAELRVGDKACSSLRIAARPRDRDCASFGRTEMRIKLYG